mmetsp:Transcript_18778/g.34056  ORF Transcript_18778/g.34056 Transcript_18778/m.34056 type:complete len:104 (+) Transcript_18778:113-424(+)
MCFEGVELLWSLFDNGWENQSFQRTAKRMLREFAALLERFELAGTPLNTRLTLAVTLEHSDPQQHQTQQCQSTALPIVLNKRKRKRKRKLRMTPTKFKLLCLR